MGHCPNRQTSLIMTARMVVKRHGIPNIELIRTYLDYEVDPISWTT